MTSTDRLHAIEQAIDEAIEFDHTMYLKATFACHDGEACEYSAEVAQLQHIRDLVRRVR